MMICCRSGVFIAPFVSLLLYTTNILQKCQGFGENFFGESECHTVRGIARKLHPDQTKGDLPISLSALGRRGAEKGMDSKRAILLIARSLLIPGF